MMTANDLREITPQIVEAVFYKKPVDAADQVSDANTGAQLTVSGIKGGAEFKYSGYPDYNSQSVVKGVTNMEEAVNGSGHFLCDTPIKSLGVLGLGSSAYTTYYDSLKYGKTQAAIDSGSHVLIDIYRWLL